MQETEQEQHPEIVMSEYSGPAIVQLMGNRSVAGMVTYVRQFGVSAARVDVPATSAAEAFPRFYMPGAIYAVKPCSVPEMMAAAELYAETRIPDAVARRMDASYGGRQ